MNTQALSDALHHLIVVIFLADLFMLVLAALIWSLLQLRPRARWQGFYTANAAAANPELEKVVDEIVAARLPTLAGR